MLKMTTTSPQGELSVLMLQKLIEKDILTTLMEAQKIGFNIAKANAPIRKGVLIGSFVSELNSSSKGIYMLQVYADNIPYAEWADVGRQAKALPYSRTGSRDYSKSTYTGTQYMQKSFSAVVEFLNNKFK